MNGDAVWWFGLVESSNSFTLQELQEGSIEVYREIEKSGKRERKRIRYVVQKKEKVSLN